MPSNAYGLTASAEQAATSALIRNTYMLLSMTLLFSAAMAAVAMVMNVGSPGILVTLAGYFGLLFAVHKLRNSAWGILAVFGLTGFMGFTLGPIINAYLSAFSNGHQLVMTALGGSGAIFLGLSAYALTSRRDFSFMGGFLFAGVMVAFLAGLAAVFLQMPGLSLAVSAMFVLLMSAAILYQTSALVHGGETNYLLATVGLYVSLYNLFLSLLQLAGFFGGED
ncbi:MAG TPA: BAX inhibitor protein [Gammaproteobacteria bacterium]|uniref:Bax inhibitor-1/YccA family protein n=1 Tax=Immundisolibacter sp. TaxID=1934948 RepID=UPI000E8A138A|nr:BAX inhibitor protein [Gammaproteobacteria bacterium]HCZ48324.1 BAX inhibitor protein [Gammaproteobacteria bacterium]MCH77762.1 BAX inhibitor protein [Gammaproteobacteria bacterium]